MCSFIANSCSSLKSRLLQVAFPNPLTPTVYVFNSTLSTYFFDPKHYHLKDA